MVIDEEQKEHERFLRIAAAVERASQPFGEGPYGLFDYTSYGDPTPHHVRDFRIDSENYGRCVFRTTDRDEAERTFNELTAAHIGKAAYDAVMKELAVDRNN